MTRQPERLTALASLAFSLDEINVPHAYPSYGAHVSYLFL